MPGQSQGRLPEFTPPTPVPQMRQPSPQVMQVAEAMSGGNDPTRPQQWPPPMMGQGPPPAPPTQPQSQAGPQQMMPPPGMSHMPSEVMGMQETLLKAGANPDQVQQFIHRMQNGYLRPEIGGGDRGR